jgi:uncharacterized membrane-anchored protein YjiN (DUF445 family)|tara:strand:- start:143 stop:412 length:270 start_codon:yes stop_codon:yes gene_type:complete
MKNMLLISPDSLKQIVTEELTKSDKEDIEKMISKSIKSELKDVLQDELEKALKTKDSKTEIGEITKSVIKKLYKDLAYHHPYVIDRIKV